MDYFDYNYDVIGLNFITTRVANKCTAMLKMLHIGVWFLFYKVTMEYFSILHGDSSRELHDLNKDSLLVIMMYLYT